jgi:hypothetical protein
MKLVITIDTEEDNWGHFSSTGHTLKNIDRIPYLQGLFDAFNVKPTYLITYPVAVNDKCIDILGGIEKSGRCEIGTHCHPWNTPPFEEELNEKNSMLCNLSADLQYKKMSFLHNTIMTNLDVRPVSFRSGRWGYNRGVAENLLKLGYKVDTSITSYTDWVDCHGPDFSDVSPRPFRFSCKDISTNGHLIEIPATIGFLQKNFETRNLLMKKLGKRPLNRLGIIGILHKLRLLNKVWMTPELSDSRQMIKLAQCLMKKDYEVINMFFHTTTLKAGLNQFVKTESDEKIFMQRLKDFLGFARDQGIESIKLSETVNLLSI